MTIKIKSDEHAADETCFYETILTTVFQVIKHNLHLTKFNMI